MVVNPLAQHPSLVQEDDGLYHDCIYVQQASGALPTAQAEDDGLYHDCVYVQQGQQHATDTYHHLARSSNPAFSSTAYNSLHAMADYEVIADAPTSSGAGRAAVLLQQPEYEIMTSPHADV